MSIAILNPDRAPRSKVQNLASGLHVVSRKRFAYFCRVCGKPFHEEEERRFTQHTIACAKANEEEIRQESDLSFQMPGMFGPEAGDVERKKFMRERHGWRV